MYCKTELFTKKIEPGATRERLRGLKSSLSHAKVKKKDKISGSFDLFCVSVI